MLESSVVQKVLGAALRSGGDWAEVFVEDRQTSSGRFDDGRIEELSSLRDRGAGIRVVVGETTGFAHTADLSENGLRLAAEAASAVARSGGGGVKEVALTKQTQPQINDIKVLPETIAKADKVELLKRANAAARGVGGAITQVTARYGDQRRRILVANSDGLLASDDQVRTNCSVIAVASGDTGMQTGYRSSGYTVGWELFDKIDYEAMGRQAAETAISKLKARPAPSGAMPVVLAKGSGGVMFHEACGHGLEADAVQKNATVYAGRVGELVASPLITLVDDGTMGPEWGSLSIDDEGRPTSYNVLIQDGVLTDYMWDFMRARKAGREASSGNGRRQSYEHLPMVRMTNTYVLAGEDDPEEIVRQTPHGVYVAHLGGGQVNPATGDFVFGMEEAFLIENGEITEPLREANLIGNGPEVLKNIDAIGNDFAMGSPGMCGKQGQGVPVGDGQPTLRITSMTIGGTAS
ncbi:MAG: TldD/PmbA family protein [Acidimicrobiales bacterium]|nr:TldD/PmbA family protein [Acidimicrobiales bacterium]